MSYSYATQRKIRIIEENLGPDWMEGSGGQSIDAIYNRLIGDKRKNLFCKIDADAKDHVDIMTKHHKSGMADFIEQLICAEWMRYQQRQKDSENLLLREFGS